MTIAERLRLEGHSQGLQEGLLQGQQEAALRIARTMLAQGMDRAMVLLVTGLNEDDLATMEH